MWKNFDIFVRIFPQILQHKIKKKHIDKTKAVWYNLSIHSLERVVLLIIKEFGGQKDN